jgi:hypothetical protein
MMTDKKLLPYLVIMQRFRNVIQERNDNNEGYVYEGEMRIEKLWIKINVCY